MLVLSLHQNGSRRIESLLSSPNRAITVQRMFHWQMPAQNEINNKPLAEAEVSADSSFPKRADSLWKVGAHVSAGGGVENTVTNAVSIGSVTQRWSLLYQTFDSLARANSFEFFLKSPFLWKSPSPTPQSISEFKERMKKYGYANNMVLCKSNLFLHIGNPNRFVSAPVYALA